MSKTLGKAMLHASAHELNHAKNVSGWKPMLLMVKIPEIMLEMKKDKTNGIIM